MLALAWRNIWRQRTRSLGAAIAVAFVVLMSLMYFGLVAASGDGLYARLTEAAGHIQIHIRNYRDLRDFRQAVIPDAAEMRGRIAAAYEEGLIVSALDVPALLSGEVRSRGVLLEGIEEPQALRERFERTYLAQGRLPAGGELDTIAVGGGLARTLKVGLGDPVYAYAPGTDGIGASAFTVVGLLHFPEANMDARAAVTSLAAAQELAAPGAVSRFELHFPSLRRTIDDVGLGPLSVQMQRALGSGVVVETWRQVYPAMSDLEQLLRPITLFYVGIFFILAGLLVVNTVYLSLIERTREFGMIIALGTRRGRVMRMVLAESLLLCGTGAAVGLSLGVAFVWRLAQGFKYPLGLSEVVEQFGMPAVLYASLQPVEVLITVGFALGTGLLAALWPAWVAGRLEPVEAMRFVA